MPPQLPTPEQIADSPKRSWPLPVDANVVAYFGDLLLAFKVNLAQVPGRSDRSVPGGTASSHSQS
jgi:hypothetical protein